MKPGALRASDDEAVRAGLEAALGGTPDGPRSVAILSRRPFAYESSFAIDELCVRTGDGEKLALLVKDVGGAGLSRLAATAKPRSTIDPGREIAVYRDLLAAAGLSTPRFFGACVDAEAGRWWLFLERIGGEVLSDVGEISVWQEAAAWAARLGPAVRAERATALDGVLLDRDAAWHGHWIEAAAAAPADSASDGAGVAELSARLRRNRSALVERLESLPRAFLHGELYPSNVVVERGQGGAVRIAPVDWELAGSGPYALDLAALISGWGREEQLSICRAFHGALGAAGGAPTGFEELVEATTLCRLSLALQWIGWAPGWRAPAAHRHDWRGEASELLDEVGLR